MTAHIHDALNAIINSPGSFESDAFAKSLKEKFGYEIKFSNCSGMEISADEVVQFLLDRSKIEIKEGKIYPLVAQTCSHH